MDEAAAGVTKPEVNNGTDDWDPLRQDFESILNFGFASKYLPSALVVGGLQAEGEYSSIRDVPCKFDNGMGGCFKGRHCVKAHYIAPPSAMALRKLVIFASALPQRSIEEPKRDITFVGKVCFVKSPLEFYILPQKGIECVCGCDKKSEKEQAVIRDTVEGYAGLARIQSNLTPYINARKRAFQLPEYDKFQLVAVEERGRWYRGIVLEKVTYNNDPYAKCEVAVHLLDFGENVKVLLHEVTALPVQYTAIAPMIIKCQLDGIVPGTTDSSQVAIDYFKGMVLDKEVLVTYRSRKMTPIGDGDTLNPEALQDDFLYSVQLRLKKFPAEVAGTQTDPENILGCSTGLTEDYHSVWDNFAAEANTEGVHKRLSEFLDRGWARDIGHQLQKECYCLLRNPLPNRLSGFNARLPTFSVPQTVHQAPEAVFQTPETVFQTPEAVFQTPETLLQPPQTLLQPPQTLLQPPQTLLQASEAVFQTPEPGLQAPETVLQASEIVLQASEAVFQTPETVLGAPDPRLQTPEPVRQAPEPVLQASEPVLQAPEPTDKKQVKSVTPVKGEQERVRDVATQTDAPHVSSRGCQHPLEQTLVKYPSDPAVSDRNERADLALRKDRAVLALRKEMVNLASRKEKVDLALRQDMADLALRQERADLALRQQPADLAIRQWVDLASKMVTAVEVDDKPAYICTVDDSSASSISSDEEDEDSGS